MAPAEGMPMLVPICRCLLDRLDNLVPAFKSAAFEGQGAQHLPPGLNQVEVSRILGREDKLPTRMPQREEQDIGGAMNIEIVHNRIHPLSIRREPWVGLL